MSLSYLITHNSQPALEVYWAWVVFSLQYNQTLAAYPPA